LEGGTPTIQFPKLYRHNKRKKMVAEALLNDQWIRDVMHDLNMHLIDELVKLWGLIEDL
jgi:hypothetical protein